MDYYFIANSLREFGDRLELAEFYNDGVNNEIELKSHYSKWLEARTSDTEEVDKCFTLCSYPWILNTSSKSELLQWENEN